MIDEFILRWARKIIKKRRLEVWKNEKRKKWLDEGMAPREVERKLRPHKIK